MNVSLEKLLKHVPFEGMAPAIEVNHISLDSRVIKKGGLFVALAGEQFDGRDYIDAAIEQGASAVLYDDSDGKKIEFINNNNHKLVPVLAIKNLTKHTGTIANNFYGAPSEKLKVIGITGTNGKTTCAHILASSLDQENGRCAIIGTLGNGFPNALEPTLNTTPDVFSVHRLMADFLQKGARYICMEVSSHALVQGRVNGVAFDIAVFTNLSRDHLDYHGDMNAYGMAKEKLFNLASVKHCIINNDDDFGAKLLQKIQSQRPDCNIVSYGIDNGLFSAISVVTRTSGIKIRVATGNDIIDINTSLIGRFNVYNILAVLACLKVTGKSLKQSATLLEKITPVAGRMEQFKGHNTQPLVIVDYAHTPDALEKTLSAIREHCRNIIWCVFGCGGDRDRGKRPLMGQVAGQLADRVILTNDNPRSEQPEKIIQDIESGLELEHKIIFERKDAIQYAITNAGSDDVVLVAGKGHENYQLIGKTRIEYSDRLTVSEILRQAA